MLGDRKLRAAAESARAASGPRWGEMGRRGRPLPSIHHGCRSKLNQRPIIWPQQWQPQNGRSRTRVGRASKGKEIEQNQRH